MLAKQRPRTSAAAAAAAAYAPLPAQPTRKRTHLKPSQVAVLQESFVTNPLPDAAIRSRLARELGVTERTIQIWFQNRRAKARKLDAVCSNGKPGSASKIPCLMPSVRTGWIEPPCPSAPQRYQATFRTMMTPERFEQQQQQQQQQSTSDACAALRRRARSCSNGRPEPLDAAAARAASEGADRWASKQAASIPFPVTSLRVGSWSRFTSNAVERQECWDLFCFAQERQLIWQIHDGGHQFRMQIDFDAIQQLVLSAEVRDDAVVDQLAVHLFHPGDLTFSMWRTGVDHDWVRCGDFSENKQASFDALHILQGAHDSLRQPLLQLFTSAPDLFSKCSMDNTTVPPPLDLCRRLTLSPSATPEPFQSSTAPGAGSQDGWMMHHDPDAAGSFLAAAVAAAAAAGGNKPVNDDCWTAQPAAWSWSSMLHHHHQQPPPPQQQQQQPFAPPLAGFL